MPRLALPHTRPVQRLLPLLAMWALVSCAQLPAAAPPTAAAPVPSPSTASLPTAAPAAAQTQPGLHTLPFDGGSLLVDTRTPRCRVVLRGAVSEITVRRMHSALQALEGPRCSSRVLQLETSQAEIGSTITLGAMLRNRRFDTEVTPGHACDTPCTLLFVAGTQRAMPVLPQAAHLALTRLPPDADFGTRACRSEPSAGQQLSVTRYLAAMLPDAVALGLWQRVRAADCLSHERITPTEALRLGWATTVIALP